jgi:hypothetical protein
MLIQEYSRHSESSKQPFGECSSNAGVCNLCCYSFLCMISEAVMNGTVVYIGWVEPVWSTPCPWSLGALGRAPLQGVGLPSCTLMSFYFSPYATQPKLCCLSTRHGPDNLRDAWPSFRRGSVYCAVAGLRKAQRRFFSRLLTGWRQSRSNHLPN